MKKIANKILILISIFFIIILGCQNTQTNSKIKVLSEKIEKNKETQRYVINGGPGSTEAEYEDVKGEKKVVTSNVVKVPIKEVCEKKLIEEELLPEKEEEIPEEELEEEKFIEEIPLSEFFSLNVNTFSNGIVLTGYHLPEITYETEVFIPKKPPKIKLTKSTDEDILCCDRELTFRIKFENIGGDNAFNVKITDVIPAEVEYLENSAGSEPYLANIIIERGEGEKAKKITWIIKDPIPPGASGEVYYTVTCPKTQPELSCYIRFKPPTLKIGEEGKVLCGVINSGTGKAEDVKLHIIFPQGIEYKGKSLGQKETLNLGTILPGKSVTKELKIRMRSGGKLDKIIASVTAKNGEGCKCLVPPAPTLKIEKTGPEKVNNRLPVEYTIVVKNTSIKNAPATNCILTDKLPKFSFFKSASHKGKYDPKTHTVKWELGTLKPGDIVSRTVIIIPQRGGEILDKAKVTCDEGITVTDTAKTIVRGITALHVMSYDTEDPVEVGNITTYIIEVTNEGFKNATGVKVINEIPRLTKFLTAEGKDPEGNKISYKVEGRKVIFDPVPNLNSGDKLLFKVTVKVTGKPQLLNVTYITCNEFDKTLIIEEPTNSY